MLTQREALDTAKALDSLPEDAREQVRQTWREPGPHPQGDDQGKAPNTTALTARPRRPAGPDRSWLRAMQTLSVLLTKTEKTAQVCNQASSWTPTARHHYLQALRRVQDRVTTLIGEIDQQERERPERQDGSTDAIEPTAPLRAEAPEPRQDDFEALRRRVHRAHQHVAGFRGVVE